MKEGFAILFALCYGLLIWSAPKNFLWLRSKGAHTYHLLNTSIGLIILVIDDVVEAQPMKYVFVGGSLWYIAMLVLAFRFPQEYSTRGMVVDWFRGGSDRKTSQK